MENHTNEYLLENSVLREIEFEQRNKIYCCAINLLETLYLAETFWDSAEERHKEKVSNANYALIDSLNYAREDIHLSAWQSEIIVWSDPEGDYAPPSQQMLKDVGNALSLVAPLECGKFQTRVESLHAETCRR